MLARVLLCLLATTKVALCGWPFGSNFAYWLWQSCKEIILYQRAESTSRSKADNNQAVVVDNWLYIEGGEYYILQDGTPSFISSEPTNMKDLGLTYPLTVSYVTDANTYSIDLSQSWTIDAVNANTIPKPQAMAPVRRPPLWYDPQSNRVIERGGWAYTAGASYFLWSFTPDGQGGAQLLLATFGGAFTASPTGFYNLGGAVPGALNTSSDSLNPYGFAATEGLITYDFASGEWNNISSIGGSQTGYSVQSQAVSMPDFGKAGLLAFLGGDSPSNQSYLYEAGAALVDMSNITVYDIHSDTWYYQTATGDIPPPRSEFCAVGSSPADNSSYEM
jgi:hypothetical protein